MKTLSFRGFRRVAAWMQTAIMLCLPFLRVHGESALRFDVPSLKLYFFGSVIWISEAYFFLLVFLLFFIGIMLVTVLYGRIWCGWMCPQTVLSDFARRIDAVTAWFRHHQIVKLTISHSTLVLLSTLVSANLIWYFVSPYDMIKDVVSGSLGPWTSGSWFFFTALIYLDLAFVRQKFCGSVCPYARFQSAFYDDRTLTIAFDLARADECIGCEACVRSCPAHIDIRKGLQVECINCAECIDACSNQMEKKEKMPLVRYFYGVPGNIAQRGTRTRVIGLSLAFAAVAMLFAYQVYVRVPVDFWVFRDERQMHEPAGIHDGIMNSYSLTIENRSLNPAVFQVGISGIKDAELDISQNPLILSPNTGIKVRVYVYVQRKNLAYRVTQLRFSLENISSREIRVEQQAPFIYPDQTEQGKEI
jgi:cytochrome c oxidase accessory protein FixG